MVKIVIGDKSGKTKQLEIATKALNGKKIAETFKGELIDMPGYEFEITGGSDNSGFPMRKDVDIQKKRILITAGEVGFTSGRNGERRRKTVAGKQVSDKTAQINVKVIKVGKQPLSEQEAQNGNS